ncbi:phytoene desaturase family protein [Quadrisphaera oryzae]|uniref:phytoene desaturase family protein n=1 Tax=Quadrisphaera TaxID=317661 RepID=UPI001645BC32|nr:NAD(P)/FAD-dependent oxidoreductase [Quadrisphaera sp. RL12-1S]MBC3761552.1 NAD(P)/FAD-dependent oxidoreductase [Quadrisphaera sp. RL12-1S]
MSRAVVVGSGPNGLAAALTLADAGVEVVVYEAADTPGGGARSAELTLPGLLHDECSGFHPFATSSVFAKAFDLQAAGLRWAWPQVQYAHPLDGGSGAAAVRSVPETAAGLGDDARRWQRFLGPVVEDFDTISEEFLQPLLHLPRHPLHLARLGLRAPAPAALTAHLFRTREARALWGGLAAHGFTAFSLPLSSAIGVSLGAAAHRFGWPVAVGGSGQITAALVRLLEQRGGTVVTGTRVRDVRDLGRFDALLLDTSPGGAADIAGSLLPERTVRAYRRFRHGAAAFQLALAVDGGIPWSYEPARRAGTVHVSGSFEQTAAAEREVARGRMPRRPFVLLGQQHLADPGRAKGSVVPIDCYAHVPAGYDGDATEAVLAQLERYAPGLRERLLAVVSRPTRQIAADNPNFVGGDIVTGHKRADQLLLGPRAGSSPYDTGARGIYLCSAAVPPGPGAHGVGGHLAALRALSRL